MRQTNSVQTTAQRIAEMLRSQGLFRVQLAGETLSQVQIAEYESRHADPSGRTAAIIASRLECSPQFLASGVTANREDRLHEQIIRAREAFGAGRLRETTSRYNQLLADPALLQHAALYRSTTYEMISAISATGRYSTAIQALPILLRQTPDTERNWAEGNALLIQLFQHTGRPSQGVSVGRAALQRARQSDEALTERGITIGAALLPACIAAGDQASGQEVFETLYNLTDAHTEPELHVAAYSTLINAAQTWQLPQMVAHLSRERYQAAVDGSLPQVTEYAYDHIEHLISSGLPAEALVLLGDRSFIEAPQSSKDRAYVSLLTGKANNALDRPTIALGSLLEELDGDSFYKLPADIRGFIVAEAGRSYAKVGRQDAAREYLVAAAGILTKAGLGDERQSTLATFSERHSIPERQDRTNLSRYTPPSTQNEISHPDHRRTI